MASGFLGVILAHRTLPPMIPMISVQSAPAAVVNTVGPFERPCETEFGLNGAFFWRAIHGERRWRGVALRRCGCSKVCVPDAGRFSEGRDRGVRRPGSLSDKVVRRPPSDGSDDAHRSAFTFSTVLFALIAKWYIVNYYVPVIGVVHVMIFARLLGTRALPALISRAEPHAQKE